MGLGKTRIWAWSGHWWLHDIMWLLYIIYIIYYCEVDLPVVVYTLFCSHCHRPHCDCGSGFPRFVPEEHKKQWAMSFSQSQNDDRFSVLLWFLWPGQHVQDYLQILQGQAKRDAFQNQNLCRQLCNRILGWLAFMRRLLIAKFSSSSTLLTMVVAEMRLINYLPVAFCSCKQDCSKKTKDTRSKSLTNWNFRIFNVQKAGNKPFYFVKANAIGKSAREMSGSYQPLLYFATAVVKAKAKSQFWCAKAKSVCNVKKRRSVQPRSRSVGIKISCNKWLALVSIISSRFLK